MSNKRKDILSPRQKKRFTIYNNRYHVYDEARDKIVRAGTWDVHPPGSKTYRTVVCHCTSRKKAQAVAALLNVVNFGLHEATRNGLRSHSRLLVY